MGRACSRKGEKRKAHSILVGKPAGRRLLGRARRGWLDNITMDLGGNKEWCGLAWSG
jgi:hypothetical protein